MGALTYSEYLKDKSQRTYKHIDRKSKYKKLKLPLLLRFCTKKCWTSLFLVIFKEKVDTQTNFSSKSG